MSLVTLLKTQSFLEQYFFTTCGVESNLLNIFSASYDVISSSSDSIENLSGFQLKFISKDKSEFRTSDLISNLVEGNKRFSNFIAISGTNPKLEGITQILSEKNINFGIIDVILEEDLVGLPKKKEIQLFNDKFLKSVLHKYDI